MDVKSIVTEAGGVVAVARAVGRHHTSVLGWSKTGRVPAEHVLTIERSFGIERHRIRPDLYPVPQEAA